MTRSLFCLALAALIAGCASAPPGTGHPPREPIPVLGQQGDWLLWVEATCGIRLDRTTQAICITRDHAGRTFFWLAERQGEVGPAKAAPAPEPNNEEKKP